MSVVSEYPSRPPWWYWAAAIIGLLWTLLGVIAWTMDLMMDPAALASWGIAFFEYMLQVPANRIGYGVMSLGQLKILQEVITLGVFVPFAVYYMKQPLKLDYVWAGLCMLGAVYFMFRGSSPPG